MIRNTSICGRLCSRMVVVVLLAASSVTAHAQWLVQDVTNIGYNYEQLLAEKGEYLETAARWADTVSHYQQQIAHYQQQLVKVQTLVNSLQNIGLPTMQTMSEVPDNYLVAESCPSGSGAVMSAVEGVFSLDLSGNLQTQQRQICVNIRTVQNRKYNEAIRYIRDTQPKVELFSQQLNAMRALNNNQGTVQASSYEASRMSAQIEAQSQAWMVRNQAYDAYIATMEQNQRVLARHALTGSTQVISQLIQTAALQGALKVGTSSSN